MRARPGLGTRGNNTLYRSRDRAAIVAPWSSFHLQLRYHRHPRLLTRSHLLSFRRRCCMHLSFRIRGRFDVKGVCLPLASRTTQKWGMRRRYPTIWTMVMRILVSETDKTTFARLCMLARYLFPPSDSLLPIANTDLVLPLACCLQNAPEIHIMPAWVLPLDRLLMSAASLRILILYLPSCQRHTLGLIQTRSPRRQSYQR